MTTSFMTIKSQEVVKK